MLATEVLLQARRESWICCARELIVAEFSCRSGTTEPVAVVKKSFAALYAAGGTWGEGS